MKKIFITMMFMSFLTPTILPMDQQGKELYVPYLSIPEQPSYASTTSSDPELGTRHQPEYVEPDQQLRAQITRTLEILAVNQTNIIEVLRRQHDNELPTSQTLAQRISAFFWSDSYIGTAWCCSSTADLIITILGALAFAGVITLKH